MSAERIGKLMAQLAGAGESQRYLENTECPGAMLRVTKRQALAMAASGKHRWVMDPARIPEEGAHSWRIACRGEVMQVRRRAELPEDATQEQRDNAPTYTVTYGLCSACNGRELAMRKYLAEEERKAAEAAKGSGGSRKRAFREEANE